MMMKADPANGSHPRPPRRMPLAVAVLFGLAAGGLSLILAARTADFIASPMFGRIPKSLMAERLSVSQAAGKIGARGRLAHETLLVHTTPRLRMANFRPSRVPLERIQRLREAPEGIPSLTLPEVVDAARAKGLSALSPVVGVTAGGEQRAYPFNVLAHHRCINDVLGGVPVAVTACPFSGTTMVFDRRVNGEVLEFGVAGLCYQANTLLLDRRADPDKSSLWSPIQMRAVTGPAAEKRHRLKLLDAEYNTWVSWRRKHPESTVINPSTGYFSSYGIQGFLPYFRDSSWMIYGVSGPSGRRPELSAKEPMIILAMGEDMCAYAFNDVARAPGRRLNDELAGRPIQLRLDPVNLHVEVRDRSPAPDAEPIRRAYAFWFAWDAARPDVPCYPGPSG